MEGSKVHFSLAEEELLLNADIILTKNRILAKMKRLLEAVQQEQLKLGMQGLTGPKISRGDNYLGLPWLMLDYPRQSSGNELFFIRSMFWWGRFFSSTLHISGGYKHDYLENIKNSYSLLNGFYIGVNEDPWVHHFEPSNYQKIGAMTKEAFHSLCDRSVHLKIATYWPVSEWRLAEARMYESWKFLLSICAQS